MNDLPPSFADQSRVNGASADASKVSQASVVSPQAELHPDHESPPLTHSCSTRWSNLIKTFHRPILRFIVHAVSSARNPKKTIAAAVSLSFLLLLLGYATNFEFDMDEEVLWTPRNSHPIKHSQWLQNESGFPDFARFVAVLFHAEGANVVSTDHMTRIFEAADILRDVDGYDKACSDSDFEISGEKTCEISGVVQFWNYSSTNYHEKVNSDTDLQIALSKPAFPDGRFVDENSIYGYPERDPSTGLLTSALSYTVIVRLPDTAIAKDMEGKAVDAMLALDEQWKTESALRVEVLATDSYPEEFTRGIIKDIPLVPVVFAIMSAFICFIFWRRDPVLSRRLLGFGAVVATLLSIMTGYGLLFLCGVPFTSMTQILPFVIFGIGMDDAVIMIHSFARTDTTKDPVDRIADAMEDVGISISLTTCTSAAAFALGCLSSIPVVIWLCLYAFPTILLVYLYQLSFFVACIVLDENRVTEGRRDCCAWRKANESVIVEPDTRNAEAVRMNEHFADRFMVFYADKLLRPRVKFMVAIAFTLLAGLSAWSASQFRQEFDFTDVLPGDSFVTDFLEAGDKYSRRNTLAIRVYFRFVDQSDEAVQQQMLNYLEDLIGMEAVAVPPEFFWLWDFRSFLYQTEDFSKLAFSEQIAAFLGVPINYDLYHEDIVLDNDGNVIESRGYIFLDNVDFRDVDDQISALEEQRSVTKAQPINQGREELAFFCYGNEFTVWEFFSRSVDELILTTILGIAAVTGFALVMIPHWSAALFTLPLLTLLYVDLTGALQWAGIHINAVSYVGLVLSIGLLVDYIMHVLLRFYEAKGNRKEKTVTMLRTMGSSILIGGISTFLGTLPLAFASSEIFKTIFITFLGIVTIGLGHALILVPVVLSTIGPEGQVA